MSTEAAKQEKSARHRSPAYPAFDLETALQKARVYYNHEKRNPASVTVASMHWGYKATSSAGMQAVAALKSYGLIRDSGSGNERKVQLTDLALKILLDERDPSPEREHAVKESALSPKIHKELWSKWKSELPSDQNLRFSLRHDYKFNDNVVDEFIREYKKTLAFAKLNENDSFSPSTGDITEDEGEEQDVHEEIMAAGAGRNIPPAGAQVAKIGGTGKPVGAGIPVTANCVMSIMATGDVTQKGIDQMIAYLNLIKGSFPKDEQQEQ